MPGGNPTRDNRMGMTVHNVREVLCGLPPCSKFMNPIPPMPYKTQSNRYKILLNQRRQTMSPEEEWAYEEKLDRLSYQLQELVLDVFIAVVEKLKDRNQPLDRKPSEDDMQF